jgi:hypothetical protein
VARELEAEADARSGEITRTVRRLFTLPGPRLAGMERRPRRPAGRPMHRPAPKGGAMEPPTTGHDAISREESSVHNWHVSQLRRLGLSGPLAEIYADRIDWHQVARLVQRGCPPRLALRIVR